MSHRTSKIINDINSILLPQVCFGCNTQLYSGEHLICTVCRNDLPLTEYNFTEENAVDRIFYGRIPIIKASSFLFYAQQGIVQHILHYLKYKNQEIIGDFFGKWYGEILKKEGLESKIDVIIPVPLHKKKLRKRGYNQVDAFGKQLAKLLKADFINDILIKTTNIATQTKKSRLYRWQTSENLYDITDFERIRHKNVLLVDDVITTGATIEACGTALLKIEGIQLYVATMAFVPKLRN